jgi:hypothetical protein
MSKSRKLEESRDSKKMKPLLKHCPCHSEEFSVYCMHASKQRNDKESAVSKQDDAGARRI